MVAKIRERWAVSKQAAQKFGGEKFNLKQYQIEITNRFAALDKLSDSEDINRT